MRLNRAGIYAFRGLAYMAAHPEQQTFPSHIVARAMGIPERFLLKVLKPLVNRGVLLSLRGPSGGYALARPPRQINALEVIEAVEGPISGLGTPPSGNLSAKAQKKLDRLIDEVNEAARARLEKVKLSELVIKK